MRKIILGLLLFIVSCGSGGGGSSSSVTGPSTKGSAPLISNLRLSPDTASYMQGGGAITVYTYIDFIDADGDITTGSSSCVDTDGTTGTNTIALSNISNKTKGTILLTDVLPTTKKGVISCNTWVTDTKDNSSNKLTMTFTVS